MNTSTTPLSPLPDAGADPRNRADFQPRFYPHLNGQEAPAPGSTERNERIQLEFAAAYYELNCAHSLLARVRQEPESEERAMKETKHLQSVERLLMVRDGLEDQYAPFGVIAEPVVKDGFTVNLKISFGNVDAAGKLRSELYTITACVPIPWTPNNREGLDLKIEGPGIPPP
jgi:hypothetical protein